MVAVAAVNLVSDVLLDHFDTEVRGLQDISTQCDELLGMILVPVVAQVAVQAGDQPLCNATQYDRTEQADRAASYSRFI
jgi:hypothetical protein